MTLILRSDLHCSHSDCSAYVVEMRTPRKASEFRCKTHGIIRPLVNPQRPPVLVDQRKGDAPWTQKPV